MAKRKKAKKTGSRRRRVSGIDKAGIQQAAMVVAGFAAGQLLSNAIDGFTKSKPLDPKIKGAILFAAGSLVIPKVMKGSPLGKQLGLGVSVAGGAKLLSALGIKGLGAAPVYVPMRVSGSGVRQMVAGGQGISQTVGNARTVALHS